MQEREGFASSPVAMPTRMTRKGFPTVHQLDFSSLSGLTAQPDVSPSHMEGGMAQPPKKKKSLFAQQLERHGLEYFGIEVTEPTGAMATHSSFKKDFVEPVKLIGGVRSSTKEAHVKERVQSESAIINMTGGQDSMELDEGGGVAREEFESDASQTWKRQVP